MNRYDESYPKYHPHFYLEPSDYDEGYKDGRADVIDELEQKLRVWDNKANAIPSYVWHCINMIKK